VVSLKRSLSIAILGTRGVPPNYGGFETMAAELGVRLVDRGHRVTVYSRGEGWSRGEGAWRGIRTITLPAVRTKHLETVTHTFISTIDALGQRFDAVLLCNAANAFVLPLFRIARVPVAVNVDGIERKRKKWNAAGRAVYQLGESMTVRHADRVIADADVIRDYYLRTHGASASVIAYGADFPDESDSDVLARLSLSKQNYVLYVSRFEPENHPLEVVEEYRKVGGDVPLVLVGAAPYSSGLTRRVRAAADPRVVIPGGVYGADYRTLQRNALLYVQATEVGGTHPAMIEAMASGGAVIANGTPENREVGGDDVRYFDISRPGSLARLLESVLHDPRGIETMREPARRRAAERYSWDAVVDAYESLFHEMAGASHR
jgi:glycosyltransferase involved in cell wall biosynthesis